MQKYIFFKSIRCIVPKCGGTHFPTIIKTAYISDFSLQILNNYLLEGSYGDDDEEEKSL